MGQLGAIGVERQRAAAWVPVLFAATSFLAAGLIFVVQPLVARTLLPVLGGSASVWNSAMVTFQVLLLGGYLIAHLAGTRLHSRASGAVLLLLSLVAIAGLPVGLREGWGPDDAEPALWTLWAVAAAVGLPFLALSCVSPTLQRWYGALRPDADPYVLYATGNAGSFIGLLAYPLVIERTMGINLQQTAWTAAYLLFVALFLACGWLGAGAPTSAVVADVAVDRPAVDPVAAPATRRDVLRWIAMAAGPSLLLLGVTRHLATDVAAVPLLWVIPLSAYLLTFVIAFSGRGTAAIGLAARGGILLAGIAVVSLVASLPGVAGILLHLAAFSTLALAVHGRLAAERPALVSLTAFYLAMSTGGALGGLIGGLIAPVAFPGIWEYPLGIVACAVWLTPRLGISGLRRPAAVSTGVLLIVAAVLRTGTTDADGPARSVQLALALAFVALLVWARTGRQVAAFLLVGSVIALALPGAAVLEQERTYYGVTRVLEDVDGWHLLVSGTTVHGAQDPARPDVPLTYYAPGSPLTDAVRAAGPPGERSIGVVGLGAGSMAAWTEGGDQLTFYEIDPAVIRIATDPETFSFIADARGEVQIVEGDGRLSLAGAAAGSHDLIVIDAFSSDAIPVHLVTREALATYRAASSDHGIITFHISNRFFDLAPVIAALAHDAGLASLVGHAVPSVDGATPTDAVAVGDPAALAELAELPNWQPGTPGPEVWTDDRADVLGALRIL